MCPCTYFACMCGSVDANVVLGDAMVGLVGKLVRLGGACRDAFVLDNIVRPEGGALLHYYELVTWLG